MIAPKILNDKSECLGELPREKALRLCLEELVPTGVAFFDKEKRLQYCNNRFEKMAGRPEEALRSDPLAYKDTFYQKEFKDIFDAVSSGQTAKIKSKEFYWEPKRASSIYIKLFMTPVLEGDNTLGYMLVVMDKSDVKRLRSQLAAAFTMQIRR
jgi:PAS domain-containing protein